MTDPDIEKNIYLEINKILYANLRVSAGLAFLCATLIFIGLWTVPFINLWYFLVIASIVLRGIFAIFYYHKPEHFVLHRYLFNFGVLLSGILWGGMGSYYIGFASADERTIVMVILAGVSSGAVLSLHASLFASMLFSVLSILPLCIWLFLQQSQIHYILGVSIATYLIFILAFDWRSHSLLIKSLHLRYENLHLIDELSTSNATLERQEHEMSTINKINEMLQLCQAPREIYPIVKQTAQKLFPSINGELFSFNKITNNLEMVVNWGEDHILKSSFPAEECWAFRSSTVYIVDNPNVNVTCQHFLSPPIYRYMCIPLIVRSQIIGMLNFNFSANEEITNHKKQIMMAFAEGVKLSLANIHLHEALKEEATHDPLTTLLNRRYLNEVLPRELLRTIREKNNLCVAMLDLDHFKELNDTNGHEAGDMVLKHLAQILKRKFRGNDIVCRFGGEEFIIALPNANIQNALPRLEEVREELKNTRLQFQGKSLPSMTVSIGVAEAPKQAVTADDIIRLADNALYQAKNSGRDKIMISSTH